MTHTLNLWTCNDANKEAENFPPSRQILTSGAAAVAAQGLIRSHKTPSTAAAPCPQFTQHTGYAHTPARTQPHTLPWESGTVNQSQQLGHLIVISASLFECSIIWLVGEGSRAQIAFHWQHISSWWYFFRQHSFNFHRSTTSSLLYVSLSFESKPAAVG